MNRTWFSYKGIKPLLAGLVILTSIQGVMTILQAYYLADTISSLFGGDLFSAVQMKLAFFSLAFVIRQLLSVSKKKITFRFAAKTSENVRKLLLEKLFQLGPRFLNEQGTGQTVTLVMEGIFRFRRYLELSLPKFVHAAVVPAIIVVFIFFLNIRSAVILVVTLPILIVFMILLGLAAKNKADRQYASYRLLANHFVDSLRGLETLKYLGLSKKHIEKIKLVSESYRKATIGTLRIAFLSSFALEFFTMLSIATVAVFLGLSLIDGTIGLQKALTILILAPEYFLPIREAGADYHATLDGKESGKTIDTILKLEMPQEHQDPIPVWNINSILSFKGIGMVYRDSGHPTLSDIHFSISGFQKVGIIGASGSGKTTLVNILSGFLKPTSGELQVNGKRISTLSQADWQNQITYIPQRPYVFHETVLNNIRFYRPEATEEEAAAAARKAGIMEVIQALPAGFETVIGEGGRILSGGQEQRIALARAFLSGRPIIILDEPTAHLDIETEYELKKTMLELFEGRLILFATHRLHWMPEMDQIIVLDNGKIVEFGSHQQLVDQRSVYNQLVKTQLEEV